MSSERFMYVQFMFCVYREVGFLKRKRVSSKLQWPVVVFCVICVKFKKRFEAFEALQYQGLKIDQNWRTLCGIACFCDESWLTFTTSNNLCELYSQVFSRAFLKVIKSNRAGIIVFSRRGRIIWASESRII